MAQCSAGDCGKKAITAIGNKMPKTGGLVTTIWQLEENAPKNAARYCGEHGVRVATGLAALTDRNLTYTLDVTTKEES